MAANPTPVNDSELLAQCHDLIGGCTALETVIGIKQHTAARMQPVLDAARAALLSAGLRTKERGDAREAFRQADADGEKVIGRCRLRLAMLFGNPHSVQWAAAGFHHGSTMVPEVFAQRLVLLSSLAGYFALKPEHESADMQATAAVCQSAHDALGAARSAVNESKAALRSAVKAKNAALRTLRKKMRGLIQDLGYLLAEDDARWRQFGLNIPAKESMPKPVRSVQLTAIGNGMVKAEWPAAPHATRYRVQWREMGAGEFVSAETVHETNTILRKLTPGQFIEVRIVSANAVDEASPSPAASVTVG